MQNKIKFSLILILSVFIILTGAECQQAKDGGLFKSNDQAENWEQKTYMHQDGNKAVTISDTEIKRIVFDPVDSQMVYLTTYNNGVYKSYNAGENWEQFYFNQGYFRDLIVNPQDPLNIYACNESSILHTQDGGENWETVYTDTKGGQIMKLLIDHYSPQNIYAFTSVSTIIKSEDYGVNWSLIYETNKYVKDALMNPYDSRMLYVLDNRGWIYKTTDGGSTWEILNKDNNEYKKAFPKADLILTLTIDPNDPQIIYTSSAQGVLKSTDGGNTWLQLNTLIPKENAENEKISNLIIAPGNSEIIYFSVGRLIHKSTDGGSSWKTIENFPSSQNINVLAIDPKNSEIIYAGVKKPEEESKGLIGT